MSENENLSLTDALVSYLKERVESPFFVSFIFSWIVINRDFIFYLIFKDDNNKHNILSTWNFSGEVLFYFHSQYASSFINPIISALIISLTFTPFSLLTSALRYYLSSKPQLLAKQGKENFNKLDEINKTTQKIKTLNAELKILTKDVHDMNKKKDDISSEINKNKETMNNISATEIIIFASNSMNSYREYKENKSKFKLEESPTITTNCVLSYKFIDTNKSVIEDTEVPIHELILNKKIFKVDKIKDTNLIHRIISGSNNTTYGFALEKISGELQIKDVKVYTKIPEDNNI